MAYEFIEDQPKGRYEFIDEPAKPEVTPMQAAALGQNKTVAESTIAAKPVSRAEKVFRGAKDPIDAAAQLFEKMMPEGFNAANRNVNNWIADKTGLLAKMPAGGVDSLIKQQEREYQAKRAASGESGFDAYRTIGNVVSPVNLAVAAKLPVAASLAGRVGYGVLGGGASGALSPVHGGGAFWDEKANQVAMGAAFGGATPAVAGGIARVISPNASKNAGLDSLTKEGIKPTVGQTLGGWANRMEEKAQSLPLLGDAIAAARSRTGEEFNRAAFNRALGPVGEKLPMNVKLGGDAVEYTRKTLGNAYDDLLPKLTTQADDSFFNGITSLKAMVADGALDPKYAAKFEQILNDRVLNKFQGQSSMTGETLKATQEHLTKEIKRYGQSQDPDARLLGDALKEVGSQLNSLVTRSNPKYADQLKAINTGYANFKRVQKAAASLGSDDGVFTPAQLQNAVKAADFSKDKARFAEGNALMQDLSGAGKTMLSNKVPDSGTAGRMWLGGGALASGAISPAIPAALLGGAAMYTPQAQSLLRGLVSARPESAQAAANALRKTSPFLVPAGAQFGLGLLN